jgi:hypothetical protein
MPRGTVKIWLNPFGVGSGVVSGAAPLGASLEG